LKLVTISQMREIERKSGLAGVPPEQLMENAGRVVAEKIIGLVGEISAKKVVILVGPGNNGGDGLVAARHLASCGALVQLIIPVKSVSNEFNLRLAMESGACLVHGLNDLEEQLSVVDICLDGFFGTGNSRPIEGEFKRVLQVVDFVKNHYPSLLTVAIDVPSGLDGDSGAIDPASFIADHTLTLGYPKIGLFNSDFAISIAGKIEVLDIGIPADITVEIESELIDGRRAAQVIPRRRHNAHKGTAGKLLVVAGSGMYPGAAALSSAAAARSGAGLVTLAISRSLVNAVVPFIPEATYLPLDEMKPWIVTGEAVKTIAETVEGYSALLVGCGISQTWEAGELLRLLIDGARKNCKPLLLDADGLNILAANPEWHKSLPQGCILTPHPGEMGRLSGLEIAEVQSDRIGVARRKAREWNQVIVLKGAYTVIAGPDGCVMVNPQSNPALASAGTGDVLAGVIAGLLTQGLNGFDASWLGVYLHSQAGVAVARERGTIGVLASDLLPFLPLVINSLSEVK
jgi:hydroxyethylthiazole kinase-like uncharacterized protein yjeF